MNIKKIVFGSVLVANLVFLTACTESSKVKSPAEIQEAGKIVVATNPEFAPFEFQTVINGKNTIVGADVQIAKEIAKKLKVTVEFSAMSFDNVLNSLHTGQADIAMSGISKTKERSKVYDFSEPYYTAINKIIIRKSDLTKYQSLDSFKGAKVGTQKGTIQEKVAKDQLKGSQGVSLDKNGSLITELKNGQIDAVVFEEPVAKGYIAQNDDLTLANVDLDSSDSDAYAVALPKGSTKLKAVIDEVIKELKAKGQIEKDVEDALALSFKNSK